MLPHDAVSTTSKNLLHYSLCNIPNCCIVTAKSVRIISPKPQPMKLSTLFLIILSFLIISCSSDKAQPQAAEKLVPQHDFTLNTESVVEQTVEPNTISVPVQSKSIFSKIKPGPQAFMLDPQSSSSILCKQGTRLKFEPGIFVYEDTQQPVQEKVKLSVTEYVTNADIIFAQLQTMSGKDMLETGGMLYIEASANGRKCNIKEGENYRIEIPAVQNAEGMQTFYGLTADNGNVDWIPAASTDANRGRSDLIQNEKKYSASPTFDGGLAGLYTYLHNNVVLPEGAKNVSLAAHKYIRLTFNAEGEIINAQADPKLKTYIDASLSEALTYSPCWNMPSIAKGEIRMMDIPFSADWIRDPSLIPEALLLKDRAENENYNAFYNGSNYLLASGQLGFINCDKFYNTTAERVDLFVQMEHTRETKVNLIFKDIRGIIMGTEYENGFLFANVPAGEQATVVALTIEDEKLLLATRNCIVADVNITDMQFKEESLVSLREKLNRIGQMMGLACL